jgi:hypothetical protein
MNSLVEQSSARHIALGSVESDVFTGGPGKAIDERVILR